MKDGTSEGRKLQAGGSAAGGVSGSNANPSASGTSGTSRPFPGSTARYPDNSRSSRSSSSFGNNNGNNNGPPVGTSSDGKPLYPGGSLPGRPALDPRSSMMSRISPKFSHSCVEALRGVHISQEQIDQFSSIEKASTDSEGKEVQSMEYPVI